jgi:hypothetical protein
MFSACCVLLSAPALTCAVQGGNPIGDDGAKSIAAAVKGNSSLQRLGLVRCSLGFLFLLKLRFFF